MPLPAVHPGSVLLEELIERDWSPSYLAGLIGHPLEFTQKLLRSDETVTPVLAATLEAATEIPASLWRNLQVAYDQKTAQPAPVDEMHATSA